MAVNSVLCLFLLNNCARSSCSSARICRDSTGCVMCSRSAALPKCNSSATTTK